MDNRLLKAKALELLKRFYGYTSFRPGQYEVISAVMTGRDAVVIMPTGGGKSMCYQMPALLSDGCAIVVSPLIALMEDQTSALITNGIPAAALHSDRLESDNTTAIKAAIRGQIKIMYMSPERLLGDLDGWIKQVKISLFAIDEAHCISQWGHDFRPDYTKLAAIKKAFPDVPVMALTATADRITRDDIASQLGLTAPLRWLGSFNRPNLSLKVISGASARERVKTIADLIKRYSDDSGIVYTLSREGAENMNRTLLGLGFRSTVYHAGMNPKARENARLAFSNGDVQVVCATIAFGMGIDKSNIRWVVHNNLPGNIESYYQEIGRAGRDGLPAETIMFYSVRDMIVRTSFCESSGQPLIATEKLRSMRDYAESMICRRRTLLSYFGEATDCDCGNCDICLNPPERFDGTILAQKAISALLRAGENVGIFMLTDILRGSSRAEIFKRKLHLIKTYGAGRDLSAKEWNSYILQMVQLGLMEFDITQGNVLKVTPRGRQAVYGGFPVNLARYSAPSTGSGTKKHKTPLQESPSDILLRQLKGLRKEIADAAGIPPYRVFNDKTLVEMSILRPRTQNDFMNISGVGEYKAKLYCGRFTTLINNFIEGK